MLLTGFEIGAPVVLSRGRPTTNRIEEKKRGYTKKDYDKADYSNGKM